MFTSQLDSQNDGKINGNLLQFFGFCILGTGYIVILLKTTYKFKSVSSNICLKKYR